MVVYMPLSQSEPYRLLDWHGRELHIEAPLPAELRAVLENLETREKDEIRSSMDRVV